MGIFFSPFFVNRDHMGMYVLAPDKKPQRAWVRENTQASYLETKCLFFFKVYQHFFPPYHFLHTGKQPLKGKGTSNAKSVMLKKKKNIIW